MSIPPDDRFAALLADIQRHYRLSGIELQAVDGRWTCRFRVGDATYPGSGASMLHAVKAACCTFERATRPVDGGGNYASFVFPDGDGGPGTELSR